jgi:hypothetical protein
MVTMTQNKSTRFVARAAFLIVAILMWLAPANLGQSLEATERWIKNTNGLVNQGYGFGSADGNFLSFSEFEFNGCVVTHHITETSYSPTEYSEFIIRSYSLALIDPTSVKTEFEDRQGHVRWESTNDEHVLHEQIRHLDRKGSRNTWAKPTDATIAEDEAYFGSYEYSKRFTKALRHAWSCAEEKFRPFKSCSVREYRSVLVVSFLTSVSRVIALQFKQHIDPCQGDECSLISTSVIRISPHRF